MYDINIKFLKKIMFITSELLLVEYWLYGSHLSFFSN